MAKEIRQKIVLEGEQEYNRAIREAQRNLRTLRSELRAETAEMGANATAQQKNEAKVRSLREQIREQEKIVRAYRDALDEVKEKYSDNADEIAKYEQKLNDARTALANMKNQVDAAGNSYRALQDGARQSAVENAALALSFDQISKAADAMSGHIEGIFNGVVSVISGTIGAVWGDLMEIAAAADSYTDLSAYLGASTTEVQKWDHAMNAAHGSLSSVVGLVGRLKYGGKADKVTEYFGISAENYTNDLEYIQAVLQAMYEMKDEMIANGTWDDAMSEILGARKVQEIDSILSDWPEIMRNLAEFDVDAGGIGLTEDELETMNEMYARVGLLQEKWNVFKQSVETKIFGGIALDVTSNFQGALDALIAFMDADTQAEKDAAIERLTSELTEAFTKIGEAVAAAGQALDEAGKSLQGSGNGYVKLLGDILSTVGSVLTFLADEKNIELVKGAFTALFAVWAGSKALSFVSTLRSVSGYITNIFQNRKAPNIDFGNTNRTDTDTGGAGGSAGSMSVGSMNVTTGTTATENVTTMYVQNMIGGTGGSPTAAPATGGGSGALPGGGQAYIPLPQGTDTGGYSLPAGNGKTLNLPAGNGSAEPDVIDMGDGTRILLNGGGGSAAVPDITIGADTVMFGGDIGMAGGYAVGEVMKGWDANTNWTMAVNELLEKYGLDMDNPEIRSAVEDVLYGDRTIGINPVSGGVTLPGDIEERFAAIADRYGSSESGHFSIKEARTLDEITGGISDWWDRSMELLRIANDAIENEGEAKTYGIGSHGPDEGPDEYGYFDDSWTPSEIMEYLNHGGAAGRYGLSGALPASWWTETGSGSAGGTPDENGVSRGDLESLRGLPGELQAAARKGVSDGVSGMKVEIDGQAAGRILAPYVSQEIARSIG